MNPLSVVAKVAISFILVIIISIIIGFATALPVKWLWNWLMPMLFNLPKITYWQSWGMLLLSHLLFSRVSTSKD